MMELGVPRGAKSTKDRPGFDYGKLLWWRGDGGPAACTAGAKLFGVSERAPEGRDGGQLYARSPIGGKSKELHLVKDSTHGFVGAEVVGNLDDSKEHVAGCDSMGYESATAFAAKKKRVDKHCSGVENAVRTLVPERTNVSRNSVVKS